MVVRRDLKTVHEEAVLRKFTEHLKSDGIHMEIMSRPDPPDAVVELDGKRTWVEITDAFLDEDHAIGLTSNTSDDVEHVPDDDRLIIAPDETFSNVLHSVIEAKYKKTSMRSIAKSQGPGILLVGIFTPFTTAKAVVQDESAAIESLVSSKHVRVFETIYVYEGTGKKSFHVLYRRMD